MPLGCPSGRSWPLSGGELSAWFWEGVGDVDLAVKAYPGFPVRTPFSVAPRSWKSPAQPSRRAGSEETQAFMKPAQGASAGPRALDVEEWRSALQTPLSIGGRHQQGHRRNQDSGRSGTQYAVRQGGHPAGSFGLVPG